jgi:hypothetical protein
MKKILHAAIIKAIKEALARRDQMMEALQAEYQ